jgi:hypothetical protein
MAVKSGAPLATLFSAELAEAQTKYLSMRAMLRQTTSDLSARELFSSAPRAVKSLKK